MDIFHAGTLSVVEGITEFLPISSTGHLILVSHLLRVSQTEFVKSFEIFIQLGAILAVVVLYWKRVIRNITIWKQVIAAFIPTAVIGFILYSYVKHYLLGNVYVTLLSLLIGGIILILLECFHKEKTQSLGEIEEISLQKAFLIGICQSVSIIPGVSRAAATIIGASLLGAKRQTAVEFSFLLAVPTLLAATGLDITKSHLSFSSNELLALAVGFFGSFVIALLTIKFFLRYIANHTFIPFGIYRILLTIIYWSIFVR